MCHLSPSENGTPKTIWEIATLGNPEVEMGAYHDGFRDEIAQESTIRVDFRRVASYDLY